MITHLRGRLEEKQPTRVVLDVGGVGYEVFVPLSSYDALPGEGKEVRLLIHDHWLENAHDLYGFVTPAERDLFLLLLTISGIGPRIAVSALSSLPVVEIKRAVIEGDAGRLTSISGVGRKTAERMILDLRDRIGEAEQLEITAGAQAAPQARDALAALTALGYKQADAVKRVTRAARKLGPDAEVEALIRTALTE